VKNTVLILLLLFAVATLMPLALTVKADDSTETIPLTPISSGLTSPTGAYRWLDVTDNPYGTEYQENYEYSQANVQITYYKVGTTFHGTLTAQNLKPNFAYQLKLAGFPGTDANERIGFAGRWWQEEWNGTSWINGQNLNNKGDGSSPNPNDLTYLSRRDIPSATSPTGRQYRFTGYLVFDCFITDSNGDASFSFQADSSFHVLWKTSQRTPQSGDGPLKTVTVDSTTVSVYGEWERLPTGAVYLSPGMYECQAILTEESFHGSGGSLAGNWAGAVGGNVSFTIIPAEAVPEAPLGTITILFLMVAVSALFLKRKNAAHACTFQTKESTRWLQRYPIQE
jgi:hypothetical protein